MKYLYKIKVSGLRC